MHISVIIPTFNSSKTIEKTLMSVLTQSYKPSEIIIVDDCSTDDTWQKCKLILLNQRIDYKIFALKENSGPSKARNKGWSLAKSKWIAFLDSDDIWHPKKLEMMIEQIDHNTFFLAHGYSAKAPLNQFASISDTKKSIISYRKMLFSNRFSTPAVMLKKNIKYRFNEKIFRGEDWELWLNIVYEYGSVPKLDMNLSWGSKYTYGEGGLSQELKLMGEGVIKVLNIQYRHKRISIFLYCFLRMFHSLKAIRRKILTSVR